MSVTVHNTVIMESPREAIDRVLEELALEPHLAELKLTGAEVMNHLGTLCEGYRRSFANLPPAFAMMAETVHQRGYDFAFERSRFMDLLWAHRCRLNHDGFESD